MVQNRKQQPASHGVTASGIVEAVEQDLELSMERSRRPEAVAAVEEKLGVRKPPPRAHKRARKQKPPRKSCEDDQIASGQKRQKVEDEDRKAQR